MELVVHDIVYLKSMEQIEVFESLPQWLTEDKMAQGIAVVRRLKVMDGKVAIGFRGNNRSKRLAAITPISNIEKIIRPFEIIDKKAPISHMESLQYVAELLKPYKWGIGGSLGFTLATGIITCHEESDIDIILYCERLQEVEQFVELLPLLERCHHRIDVQVEIVGIGAVNLLDYINNSSFILRTGTGPFLLDKKHYIEKFGSLSKHVLEL